MLQLGIIGTNWITHSFVEAAHKTGAYRLAAVYSRKLQTAREFAKDYPQAPALYDDLEAFFSAPLDVVYIASPNSLHYSQAMAAMAAGKHVVVEKPAFSNEAETRAAFAAARENGVLLFEAARHIHEDNFATLKALLPGIGEPRGASLTFMKYSSRYDDVLAGGEPNIFSPRFSGGSLADMGVYTVYAALYLFGVPGESHYFCRKVGTGVDGGGTVILRYDRFDVTLHSGKTADSFLPSEICGSEGTISMASMNFIDSIRLFTRATGEWAEKAAPRKAHWMEEEAAAFARLITGKDTAEAQKQYAVLEELAIQVSTLMTKLRLENGIRFDADRS